MFRTKDGRQIAVEKLTWDDAVAAISPVAPDLAKAMRRFEDDSYPFYKVSYEFGDKIINDNKCHLPLVGGGSIAFDDPNFPDELRKDLNCNKTEDPLGIILSKDSEFYLQGENEIQAQSIICPGQMFGVPKAISNDKNKTATSALELNLNAGSRSLFMLSKISDQIYHAKIKEHYGIKSDAPLTAQDHWQVFVEIANKANSSWRSDILYFSRKFINQLKSNDDWAILVVRLTDIHRLSYNLLHKASNPWTKTLVEIEREKKFAKFYPMQSIDEAEKLYLLAAGVNLGFKPATTENAAPIGIIKEAYTNVYDKLTKQKHAPVLMEAARFDPENKLQLPIYYSINHGVSTQRDLEASRNKSQMTRIDEIRRIEEVCTKAILEEKSNIESLCKVAKTTVFTYYHSKQPEGYDQIQNPQQLATEDPRFTNGEDETFPASSLFFTGCIKISPK